MGQCKEGRKINRKEDKIMNYGDAPTGVLSSGSLIGVNGSYAGNKFNLNPGEEVIIGKDAQMCSIVIDSSYKEVSRKHVGIAYDISRDLYRVVDYSSNGTWADGKKLMRGQENYFPAGTVLELADKKTVFKLGGIERPQQPVQTPPPIQPQVPPVQPQVPPVQQQVPPVQPHVPPMQAQPQQPQQGGKGFGIASMVLGIISLLISCCIPWVPFFCALLAVIFAAVSLAKKKPGKGMAIAGLVCGIISLIPAVLVLLGTFSIASLGVGSSF